MVHLGPFLAAPGVDGFRARGLDFFPEARDLVLLRHHRLLDGPGVVAVLRERRRGAQRLSTAAIC